MRRAMLISPMWLAERFAARAIVRITSLFLFRHSIFLLEKNKDNKDKDDYNDY